MESLSKDIIKILNSNEEDKIFQVIDTIEHNISKITPKELIKIVEGISDLLEHQSPTIVEKASDFLEKIKTDEASRIVANKLKSDNPRARNFAIEILAEHKNRNVLIDLLRDEDKDVRKFAIDIFFYMKDTDGVALGLKDKDINVRTASIEYLTKLRAKEKIEEVREIFERENDIYVIYTTAKFLYELGYEKLPDLIQNKFEKPEDEPVIFKIWIRALGKFAKEESDIKKILNIFKIEYLSEFLEALSLALPFIRISEETKKQIMELLNSISPEREDEIFYIDNLKKYL